jgi:phosphate/sulfate permease
VDALLIQIPATTHTYVGSILGVTAAHAFVHGQSIGAHMHWHEGEKVIAALILSPILGFVLASLLYRDCGDSSGTSACSSRASRAGYRRRRFAP